MILTKPSIINAIDSGDITIKPFNPEHVKANSYDIRISNEIAVYQESEILDPKRERTLREYGHMIPGDGFVLQPNRLYLSCTHEIVGSCKYVPILYDKSSIARLGISVRFGAGLGDLGFVSRWTLEIVCMRAVRIYPFMKIGQFIFLKTSTDIDKANMYNGQYGKSGFIEGSMMYKDFNNF